jgi:hypothetical protein
VTTSRTGRKLAQCQGDMSEQTVLWDNMEGEGGVRMGAQEQIRKCTHSVTILMR